MLREKTSNLLSELCRELYISDKQINNYYIAYTDAEVYRGNKQRLAKNIYVVQQRKQKRRKKETKYKYSFRVFFVQSTCTALSPLVRDTNLFT